MNISPRQFFPAARRDDIVTREVEGELLIYDRVRDKAHCLNETAAAIWKRCDGKTSTSEITQALARERSGGVDETFVRVDENIVWLGLDELRRKNLLTDSQPWPQAFSGRLPSQQPIVGKSILSRREAIRRIGLGAAIALPVVITITAPTPAQAGTCRAGGVSCTAPALCCSGTCSGGSCLPGPMNREERMRRH
jgi:hypothetical protein